MIILLKSVLNFVKVVPSFLVSKYFAQWKLFLKQFVSNWHHLAVLFNNGEDELEKTMWEFSFIFVF